MQITIDTSTDTHDNIKKAIKMLQSIVGEGAFSNSPDAVEAGKSPVMDIFGSTGGGDIFNSSTSQTPENAQSEGSEEPSPAPIMSMFGETPQESSGVDIISEEPAPVQKQGDEEPIEDEELFSDLFTKEELEKMGKKKENKKESKTYSKVYF